MPTGVHEFFIDEVEDDIRSQLKAIRNRPDRTAQFAQNIRPARSTEIRFATRSRDIIQTYRLGIRTRDFRGLSWKSHFRRIISSYAAWLRTIFWIRMQMYGSSSA
ncbi:hypothetical protein PMIN03_000035 [Paraphaeosphaeria minitans]